MKKTHFTDWWYSQASKNPRVFADFKNALAAEYQAYRYQQRRQRNRKRKGKRRRR